MKLGIFKRYKNSSTFNFIWSLEGEKDVYALYSTQFNRNQCPLSNDIRKLLNIKIYCLQSRLWYCNMALNLFVRTQNKATHYVSQLTKCDTNCLCTKCFKVNNWFISHILDFLLNMSQQIMIPKMKIQYS